MSTLKAKFTAVKKIDWNQATVSLYVAQRKLVNREARYELLEVDIDKPLGKKLRGISNDRITKSNAVREYDYNTADLESDVLAVETAETDLQQLLDDIESANDIKKATDYQSLLGSWIYIARLEVAGSPILYSVRKTSTTWNAKKVTQIINAIFQNNMLINLDQKDVFKIESKIDFFSFDGTLFITDKKCFETALNFRSGMIKNREAVIKEFETLGLFEDAAIVGTLVGNNVTRLRKLSQVQKSGYFREPTFRESLHKVNKKEKWGLNYNATKCLIACEESIENILRFLNNDRLN
ncbi:MAG: DUF4868 domain-containing protein, partial [Prosthecobacter sp.]|nr:DUF4868 domain-containing protein [Prosthecobacter sp.]